MGVAVISGGGTGIGAAIAAALVDDGHDVVIIGRRAEVLAATAAGLNERAGRPHAVRSVAADLSQPDEVAVAVAEIETVDVLVNNAGAFRPPGGASLSEVDAYWRANVDANLMTAVLLTEALLPRLTRPGGRWCSSARSRPSGAAAAPTRRRRPRCTAGRTISPRTWGPRA